ncbi:MAG: acetyl-CoA carboxylase, carboxyltransferase subunit beta [Eubacterium sp.]|nr:acetyl-CoA carboxylase, carboxyltransferase subunit beta [Eubacterium sp.]
MQNYFEKRNRTFLSFKKIRKARPAILYNDGNVLTCKKCKNTFARSSWKKRNYICPHCGYYMPMPYKERIDMILDKGTFIERYKDLETDNPLDFKGYGAKLEKAEGSCKAKDGVITGSGEIFGRKVLIAIMDTSFMMASMGIVAGEKITRITEDAIEEKCPLILYAASGGARMQEGMFSLMQMAKTSGAMGRLREANGLCITFLTHPTTGGVSASFASLGDYIFAEPSALIGFAGPRVIEQTIGEKLPKGFQRAAFQEEHGFVDDITERDDQREVLRKLLNVHKEIG